MFAMSLCASVYMCFVVTCWERADLLAFICGALLRICNFPIGILGRVWYLIVSTPDLCTLTYFQRAKQVIKVIVNISMFFCHNLQLPLLNSLITALRYLASNMVC